jgi:hypothetical protein
MPNFEVPNFFPADWVSLEPEVRNYGLVKKYLDGVHVVIPREDSGDPQDYETYYPDGSLHFEVGYDDDGNLTEGSTYIQNGWTIKN